LRATLRVAAMSMYVRIKRKNQTVFMHVEPPDTFGSIKAKCGEVFDVPAASINLYAGTTDEVRTGGRWFRGR